MNYWIIDINGERITAGRYTTDTREGLVSGTDAHTAAYRAVEAWEALSCRRHGCIPNKLELKMRRA